MRSGNHGRLGLASASLCLLACGSPQAPEALGEALVIVDTDAPVPALVSHLRVDVFSSDGQWRTSRDAPRPGASDWPLSFGLYAPDTRRDRVALVRLRAYPAGQIRDYRGERFAPRPTSGDPLAPATIPDPTDQPRLLDDTGVDITPTTEPQPLLTIDRLLLVRVRPGVRGAVRVVLRGACIGTMADISGGNTCIDTENTLVPLTESPLVLDMSLPSHSLAGTFGVGVPCTATPRPPGKAVDGTPLYDEEACVDGATFIFGNGDNTLGSTVPDIPARVAILPPFLIDRYEVTVGRWRQALAHGFVPPDAPYANEGPLLTMSTNAGSELSGAICTWSAAPRAREDYAMSCVDWTSARAFCQSLGGDLPTEAQWEYVAAVAGRPFRTRYPWGGEDSVEPTCARAVFGRGSTVVGMACNPDGSQLGPLPVEAKSTTDGDVSVGLGVVNLGGNLQEYMLDAFAPFTANCWAGAPLEAPVCTAMKPPAHALRGDQWTEPRYQLAATGRYDYSVANYGNFVGFRCVR